MSKAIRRSTGSEKVAVIKRRLAQAGLHGTNGLGTISAQEAERKGALATPVYTGSANASVEK